MFIEHFCLARQDESIGVKIVALSPNEFLVYGDSSSEKRFFLNFPRFRIARDFTSAAATDENTSDALF